MRNLMAAMPLMASLAACQTIDVGKDPPPAEWMVCEPLPDAPDLSPLEAFQTADGAMVYRKADVDSRDAQIASYIVGVRGAWFSCSNRIAQHRDYWGGVE